MSAPHRVCAVIPTFDNPLTVRGVVEAVSEHGIEIILVDDGSSTPGRAACAALAADGLATLCRLDENLGKGGAVKAGFAAARELGFSHVLQVDADGQHDLDRIPAFVEASRAEPRALVLGYPVYDDSAPRLRRTARRFTAFWVALELGSRTTVVDAMVGFRVYPLDSATSVGRTGNRMDFDVEIVVRMARAGTPVVNLPVRVRYPSPEAGGVSHFQPLRDNLRFSVLHARLCTGGVLGWVWRCVRLG